MKIILIFLLSFAYSVSVTFNVDMQEQYLLGGSVHIAGSDSLTETSFGYIDSLQISPWAPNEIILEDLNFDGVYSITIDLEPNTTYKYKFLNGPTDIGYELQGFEDRIISTSMNDTTLEIVCFDKLDDICNDIDNSLVEVIFSVDMQQSELIDSTVTILGSNSAFTNFGYDINTLLPIAPYDPTSLELNDLDGDNVYSTSILVDPGEIYQYKFVNGGNWNGVEQENRSLQVSEVSGIILNEVCFDSNDDCEEFTTMIENLVFKTDVSNAISNNGFELGDTLIVRWGYGETQPLEKQDTLSLLPFSYNYKLELDSVMVSEEAGLFYQYYKIINGQESREIFYNFEYTGSDIVLAERRYFDFSNLQDTMELFIEDNINSNVDQRRMPTFLNNNLLSEEVEVTWMVDLSPAYYQISQGDTLYDIQGTYDVYDVDSLFNWGVWINGPASSPANGETWTQWGATLQGTTSKKLWDDGTHGDQTANDNIYTIVLTYDETDQITQEFKLGIRGGDNESGYGLNHYESINVNDPNIYVYWGSINPTFYNSWDYDLNIPIEDNSCTSMDFNQDLIVNVIDIISLINIILSEEEPSNYDYCVGDLNTDGILNVIDIIIIVNVILG